ncbi:hypothetical protein CC1G_08817 [Coprinopsis cinerea okayama7|uniref:Uncharacterized protein n=1 Tax=Coprinopsis cinerea (strain Okayama-7 / 130 / ATCC MYA-4618 / FGSC 9003) TaxID=240176 RepID=A8N467_COPC7|nr:hypothetical protein CC1G_08817 [Coprinopsis cinerea okayama7\|eukprot:XP_001829662.2 hypothetical protein CC1G_08817 [Coprinopsis cinerea okayama7\
MSFFHKAQGTVVNDCRFSVSGDIRTTQDDRQHLMHSVHRRSFREGDRLHLGDQYHGTVGYVQRSGEHYAQDHDPTFDSIYSTRREFTGARRRSEQRDHRPRRSIEAPGSYSHLLSAAATSPSLPQQEPWPPSSFPSAHGTPPYCPPVDSDISSEDTDEDDHPPAFRLLPLVHGTSPPMTPPDYPIRAPNGVPSAQDSPYQGYTTARPPLQAKPAMSGGFEYHQISRTMTMPVPEHYGPQGGYLEPPPIIQRQPSSPAFFIAPSGEGSASDWDSQSATEDEVRGPTQYSSQHYSYSRRRSHY